MCRNEETNVLTKTLNEFYVFILCSVKYILNNTDVDKVTWYTKTSIIASGENDPDSFADALHSASIKLFKKNHRVFGNLCLLVSKDLIYLKRLVILDLFLKILKEDMAFLIIQ